MSNGGPSPIVARLLLVATAVLFSTGGAAIKSCGLTSWQIASFRAGVAAIALAVAFPAARRIPSRRALLVAVAYAATAVLFVSATKLTTAASTIFLQSSGPLYVLALGPWMLGERLDRRDLPYLAVIAAGLALFFIGEPAPERTAPNPVLGNALAAASGLTWGLTVIGMRRLESRPGDAHGGAMTAVMAGNALAFAACAPMAFPVGASAPVDWAIVALLGVFQIGLPYALLSIAIRRVPALETSILLLIEPALNPVWAWMVHGETPGALALAGGAMILGASTAQSWADVQRARYAEGKGP